MSLGCEVRQAVTRLSEKKREKTLMCRQIPTVASFYRGSLKLFPGGSCQHVSADKHLESEASVVILKLEKKKMSVSLLLKSAAETFECFNRFSLLKRVGAEV